MTWPQFQRIWNWCLPWLMLLSLACQQQPAKVPSSQTPSTSPTVQPPEKQQSERVSKSPTVVAPETRLPVEKEKLRVAIKTLSPEIRRVGNSNAMTIEVDQAAFDRASQLIPIEKNGARATAQYQYLVELLQDADPQVAIGTVAMLSRLASKSATGIQTISAIEALGTIADESKSDQTRTIAKVALTIDLINAIQRVLRSLEHLSTVPQLSESTITLIEGDIKRIAAAGTVGVNLIQLLKQALEETANAHDQAWIKYGRDENLDAKRLVREILSFANLQEQFMKERFKQRLSANANAPKSK